MPLTALIGLRETDRAAFCHTLLAHGDLTPDDLDEPFWHLVDTGRARFLEHFGWLLACRQDLSEYDQLIAHTWGAERRAARLRYARSLAVEWIEHTHARAVEVGERESRLRTTRLAMWRLLEDVMIVMIASISGRRPRHGQGARATGGPISKRPDYRFDRKAIDIPSRSSMKRGDRANCGSVWQTDYRIISDSDETPDGLWQINPEASPYRHVAMWPRALVRQMLLPTTRPGDTILDPFAGSGTTGEVAIELGLNAILIEPSITAQVALTDRLRGINMALPL